MYLISIYRLESLRWGLSHSLLHYRTYVVSFGCRLEQNTKAIGDIFKYLEDKGMHGELWGEGVWLGRGGARGGVFMPSCVCLVAIEMIANKLFAEYLERMEAKVCECVVGVYAPFIWFTILAS